MNFAHIFRLFRTIRYLKPVQITNRVRRRLVRAKVDLRPPPKLRKVCRSASFLPREQRLFMDGSFSFLGLPGRIEQAGDWNAVERPKLWLYNLHYFDWLLQVEESTELKRATIARWIGDNPPGKGNGWEPYPTSLRISNWIKWHLSGEALGDRAIASLAVQVRFLAATIEFHLLGNHLFANAKALFVAGLFFSGSEADGWRHTATALLDEQLREQILADGGHFELSPVYHCTILEDLLDVINLAQICGSEIPSSWKVAASRMLRWLRTMTRGDGRVPLFNDGAHGVAPTPQELRAYASRLAIDDGPPDSDGLTLMPESGYFRWQSAGYQVFGDVGGIAAAYIPGHTHADTLSFELVLDDRPVIVDVGTSTYDVGQTRTFERGTAAHNTVQLGDLDQSEMWASFRVGRRAQIVERAFGSDWIEATHDGYAHLRSGGMHRRRFEFASRQVLLVDTLDQRCELPAVARFHLAPGIVARREGDVVVASPIRLSFFNHGHIAIRDYCYAPYFNRTRSAKCIEVSFYQQLETRIDWGYT